MIFFSFVVGFPWELVSGREAARQPGSLAHKGHDLSHDSSGTRRGSAETGMAMAYGGVRWAFNDDDDAESMRGVAELRGHTSVLAIAAPCLGVRRDARASG